MPIEPKYIEIRELKANEDTVREIVNRLQNKYNSLMDEYEKEDVKHYVNPMDTFMIMHNFHKFSIQSIANTLNLSNEDKIYYYKTAKDTFSKSIDVLINKLGA